MSARFTKKPIEVEKMAVAGAILRSTLKKVAASAKSGVSLRALDTLAKELIENAGGETAFLNYQPEGADRPYPATLCTSVNDVVVHGVPTNRKLKNGDVLSIDLGVRYQGYYADSALTIAIGKISPQAKKLITATSEALQRGIAAAKPGNTLGDIGAAISRHAQRKGFKVIRGLTGHGIGKNLHEDPSVFNEGKSGAGLKLYPGMTLALEPMFAIGTPHVVQIEDESYATEDGSLSAHFEHTIVITEKGARILT